MAQGSPPRVRGKAPGQLPPVDKAGITPACAGKSCMNNYTTPRAGDHPRVCGEKLLGEINYRDVWGSPPRVRGKELRQ